MGDNKFKSVFTRFGENRGDGIGEKILEFISRLAINKIDGRRLH